MFSSPHLSQYASSRGSSNRSLLALGNASFSDESTPQPLSVISPTPRAPFRQTRSNSASAFAVKSGSSGFDASKEYQTWNRWGYDPRNRSAWRSNSVPLAPVNTTDISMPTASIVFTHASTSALVRILFIEECECTSITGNRAFFTSVTGTTKDDAGV